MASFLKSSTVDSAKALIFTYSEDPYPILQKYDIVDGWCCNHGSPYGMEKTDKRKDISSQLLGDERTSKFIVRTMPKLGELTMQITRSVG